MDRKWDDTEEVISGMKIAASRVFDNAKRIPRSVSSVFGVRLRRWRFRAFYRSVMIHSYTDVIRRPLYREPYCRALKKADRILAPSWTLYLCLISSSAGTALFLIGLAEAQRDAALRLYANVCE